ncbi:MAG: hypothetical protein PHR43_01395 [Dehalococcoidales bacterium]|nr:hypothetical protein [Dehalococcoidales bacterium]
MITLAYLAIGCGILGLLTTYFLLAAIQHFQINITRHWWIVAMPVIFAVIVNVCLIEVIHRYRKKRH